MFTLTFYKHGCMDKTVVEAQRYSVEINDGFIMVSVHPTLTSSGECFYIDSPEHYKTISPTAAEGASPREGMSFRQAFITNEAGKTIDRIECKAKTQLWYTKKDSGISLEPCGQRAEDLL